MLRHMLQTYKRLRNLTYLQFGDYINLFVHLRSGITLAKSSLFDY